MVDFHVRGGGRVGPLVVGGRVVGIGVGNVRRVVVIAPCVVGTVCGVVGVPCDATGVTCGVVGFVCGVVGIVCGVVLCCVGCTVGGVVGIVCGVVLCCVGCTVGGVPPAGVPVCVVGMPVGTTGRVVGGPKIQICLKLNHNVFYGPQNGHHHIYVISGFLSLSMDLS